MENDLWVLEASASYDAPEAAFELARAVVEPALHGHLGQVFRRITWSAQGPPSYVLPSIGHQVRLERSTSWRTPRVVAWVPIRDTRTVSNILQSLAAQHWPRVRIHRMRYWSTAERVLAAWNAKMGVAPHPFVKSA